MVGCENYICNYINYICFLITLITKLEVKTITSGGDLLWWVAKITLITFVIDYSDYKIRG